MALRWIIALVMVCVAVGCGSDEPVTGARTPVVVVAPETADPVVERTLSALTSYVERLVGTPPVLARPGSEPGMSGLESLAADRRAELVIVLDAHELGVEATPSAEIAALPDGAYRLALEERPDTTFLLSAAETKLGKQYAIYEVLRRLGVRFYHPEQELVPRLPREQLRARARTPTAIAREGADYVPDFWHRGYTFHGSHPLEHLEAFSDAAHPIDEAEHVNDWIVKNRGNRFRGAGRGVASDESRAQRAAELDELRRLLGFPTGGGVTLHNQQQGSSAVVDPSSPVPPQQQIESYVEKQLQNAKEPLTEFGIHFGPTEFTVTPDQETVQWIEWAGQKALALSPEVKVSVNNHITGSQPTPNFDDLGCPSGTNDQGRGDYYDLAFHTDPRLGTRVHTVMFYPLEGPAHVYAQQTFAHKLCLMQKASAQGRPLVYFPEGSWWLSFDNPIPVYLPLYIWARHRDIELVRPLLVKNGGTLEGHRMFNSGHEWGYWQQDYAVGMWHWNADVPLESVIDELTDPFCAPETWPERCLAADTVRSVLLEAMEHQAEYFLERARVGGKPGGLYTYFAGEDPADEIAAATGFEFRPVRTSFYAIQSWGKSQLNQFRFGDQKALGEMQDAYEDWLERLNAVRADVPEAGLPWFDEIVDGIEINGLRAEQSYQLYDAVLAYREGALKQQEDPAAPDPAIFAGQKLAAAEETLKRAETVIRRREAQYRYPPEQTHGGGLTPETAVPNGTTYPYRVHTKTHLLSYWTNRHEQAVSIVQGGGASDNALVLDPVVGPPGAELAIDWPDIDGISASLDLGDGTVVDTSATSHAYVSQPEIWKIGGELTLEGQPLPLAGWVVRADARARTAPDGFYLAKPDSDLARSVLASLVPRFRWAYVPGAPGRIAFVPETRSDGRLDYARVVVAPLAALSNDAFSTEPVSFAIPISPPGGGEVTLEVRINGAVATGTATASSVGPTVTLAGDMVLQDIVDALIALAGYDEKGAYQTLADVLGFDAANPPPTVPFEADFTLEPDA